MNILILDNYDSFTYNLYQYVGEILLTKSIEAVVDVVRNNELSLTEIKKRSYDRIIISPGPGHPADKTYFGICADVISTLGISTPILGVCLGLQGIALSCGGNVVPAKIPMHGKKSIIVHDTNGIFHNLPQHLSVMRYHSLIVERESLPSCLTITATTGKTLESGEIMGIRHKIYPIYGVQFHPESFATEAGKEMLTNFIIPKN